MRHPSLSAFDRRQFLTGLGAFTGLSLARARVSGLGLPQAPPDVSLKIAPIQVEIAKGRIMKTVGYNGSAPGPLLRFKEGQNVTVEVVNDTATDELVHWHGFEIASDVDGASEEGTPKIAAHSTRRYSFRATLGGLRWYHTHGFAGRDLNKAAFTGQFGIVYIEPKDEAGAYDQEFFLAIHGWDPFLSTMFEDEAALEAHYKYHTINSHCLGFGDPLRVSAGQRVLLHIVNASATLCHRLALPGHRFTVLALDGNPVPNPQPVDFLDLGVAERISAVVEMNHPGVWVLGEADDPTRNAGLGVVVEYAGQSGAPQWFPAGGGPAPAAVWDYTRFGSNPGPPRADVEVRPLLIKRKFAGNRWVDQWTLNGKEFPKTDPIKVVAGHRYRLVLDNQSDDAHPVHLHRHTFELTRIAGKATAGVLKDVVVLQPRTQLELEFDANNPGPTLFHCHQQMHMDAGFMCMVEYA